MGFSRTLFARYPDLKQVFLGHGSYFACAYFKFTSANYIKDITKTAQDRKYKKEKCKRFILKMHKEMKCLRFILFDLTRKSFESAKTI